MTSISRSALVNYSARQMFDLVNDIESYPAFMQGCHSAEVLSRSEHEIVGRLTLAKAGIKQTFTTRNKLIDTANGHRIELQMVEGTFKNFSAQWSFENLTDQASKVSLQMDFSFALGLVNFAAEKLFNSVANSQVESLVKRAAQVYG